LQALGFEQARNVHVGRLIELDVDDVREVPEMCQRLLANPLIEDYEILPGEAGAEARRAA
jgi:phosphoribosylformylglycinamidine synthase